MYIKDAPMNTLLVMRERMGEEMRMMFYVRREATDAPEKFVGAYGVATVQGYLWR